MSILSINEVNDLLGNATSWDEIVSIIYRGRIFPGQIRRLLLSGVSQGGKSTLLHTMLNTVRITCNRHMPADDFLGQWFPRDGTLTWIDGPIATAMREGRIVQFDEFDTRPLDCETLFYAALDIPPAVTLPTGERLVAKEGYGVVATMNPDPTCLPKPLFERFDAMFTVKTMSSGVRNALGPFAVQAERLLVAEAKKMQWTRPLSMGLLLAASRLHEAGISRDAMVKVLGLADGSTAAVDFLAAITE